MKESIKKNGIKYFIYTTLAFVLFCVLKSFGIGSDPGEPGELLLLGMMIDRAEMELGDTSVKLKLYKELIERF